MSEKLKRILIIGAFTIITIALAILIYYVFFKTTIPTETETGTIPDGLPTAGTGGPQVSQPTDPNFLPTQPTDPSETTTAPDETASGGVTATRTLVSGDTQFSHIAGSNLQYYQPSDGRFYRVNTNGEINTLSDKRFPSVNNVVWSPTNNEAVLEFPDGANVVFNFNTEKQITLPKHWEDFDFSNEGNTLAFKSDALDPGNRWLGISNTDGTSAEAIEPLGDNGNEVIVDWSPTKQIVALRQVNSAKDEKTIYMVGLNGENFKSVTAPGLGFKSSWSPNGQQLAFSVSSAATGYKPQLWIVDAAGDSIGANRRPLSINTWADKCTFSSTTNLICAVPKDLPVGAGLAPGIQNEIEDEIYSIDTSTGQRTRLAIPNTQLSAKQLHLTPDKKTLYIESSTGAIYSIQL
jgi:hypothetical protein